MKEKGIDDEPCPIFENHVLSDNGQGQDTGRGVRAEPHPKGQLSEELAQELAADREESAADVLKQRGWKPMEGPCVALLGEIKENKVAGMKISTLSGLKENSSPADSQGTAERGAGPGARDGRRGERDGRAGEEGIKFKMTPNVS